MVRAQVASSDQGFTLVEMVTVISLMGLISVLILGGMSFGSRVWEKADRISVVSEDHQAVSRFLRKHLSGIIPQYKDPEIDEDWMMFEGRRNVMIYTGRLPHYVYSGGAQRFALHIVTEGDNTALELLWSYSNDQHDPRTLPDVERVTLMEGIGEASFVFRDGDGLEVEEWENPYTLPHLITMKFALSEGVPVSGGNEGTRVNIAVRPMVRIDSTCVYDPVTRGCRGRFEQ